MRPQTQPVRSAAMFGIGGGVGTAVGTGLARGEWGESFLYAIPVAAVIFLTLWALLAAGLRR